MRFKFRRDNFNFSGRNLIVSRSNDVTMRNQLFMPASCTQRIYNQTSRNGYRKQEDKIANCATTAGDLRGK